MPDLFSIDNILFTLGSQSVSLLEFVAVLSGLTCVYLATKAKSGEFLGRVSLQYTSVSAVLSERTIFQYACATGFVCD